MKREDFLKTFAGLFLIPNLILSKMEVKAGDSDSHMYRVIDLRNNEIIPFVTRFTRTQSLQHKPITEIEIIEHKKSIFKDDKGKSMEGLSPIKGKDGNFKRKILKGDYYALIYQLNDGNTIYI